MSPLNAAICTTTYLDVQKCYGKKTLFKIYRENHRPAASLTNFIRNGVSSNKGVLIADIYIRTTVYINLKNIPPREPRGIEIGPSFSAEGYTTQVL
jgi:hypothetical protein